MTLIWAENNDKEEESWWAWEFDLMGKWHAVLWYEWTGWEQKELPLSLSHSQGQVITLSKGCNNNRPSLIVVLAYECVCTLCTLAGNWESRTINDSWQMRLMFNLFLFGSFLPLYNATTTTTTCSYVYSSHSASPKN